MQEGQFHSCLVSTHPLSLDNLPLYAAPPPASPSDARYHELIMAVASKYPGESRHQTALRYIMQAEQSRSTGSAQKTSIEQEGGANG